MSVFRLVFKNIRRLFLLLTLIGGSVINAQPFRLSFQHLSTENGLSQGLNAYVFQDSYGFMWLGSMEGVNRFDGRNVKVYKPESGRPEGMQDNIVTSQCFEDSKGNLWFSSYQGINYYDRDTDQVFGFRLKGESGDFLEQDYAAFHLDKDDRLWVRVGYDDTGMLHVYDTRNESDSIICPINGYRQTVWKDQNGSIAGVICTMSENNPGAYLVGLDDHSEPQVFLENFNTKNCFVESPDHVWICGENRLIHLNPLSGTFESFDQLNGQHLGILWSVTAPDNRYLFVSSFTEGLLVFDRKKKLFVQQFLPNPNNPYSIGNSYIQELYLDPQQNLWVSEWGKGVYYANLNKTRFHLPFETANIRTAAISEGPNRNVWVSTVEGIYVFDTLFQAVDHLEWYESSDGLKELPTFNQFFYTIDGQFWGNRSGQLFKWDSSKHLFVIDDQLVEESLASIWTINDGTPLLAEEGKLSALILNSDGSLRKELFDQIDQEGLIYPTKVFEDQTGLLYISDNAERLGIWKKSGTAYELQKQVFRTGYCKSFFENQNDGVVWVATSQGLLKVDQKDLTCHRLTEAKDGMPEVDLYGVFQDKSERLWMSSNQGIVAFDPGKKAYSRFGVMDGLQGNEFNNYSFLQDQVGNIWFGGMNGLNVFNPLEVKLMENNPKVEFLQIFINDEPLKDTIQASEIPGLKLAYRYNTISFDFVGMDYSDPTNISYRYMMEGVDDDWVDNEDRSFVRYANLSPGRYEFQVQCTNSDGIWSKEARKMPIQIKRPFWLSWWFYVLCSLIVATLAYTWVWYRLQQALKIERMRVEISSDLHDDVGGLLSGLAMQTELLELTAQDTQKERMQRISEMSRNAMSRMRDTVWAIDARKDKVSDIQDRIREHAEETLVPRGFSYQIDYDGVDPGQQMYARNRQAIYLICKEAMSNIAKHSKGDQVNIKFTRTGKLFRMRVHDNGLVETKNYKTTGLGLSNMKMRAEKAGGNLSIDQNQGFAVIFELPV